MDLAIKDEFKEARVAFGQNTLKNGELDQEALVELAVIARSSNDPSLKQLFTEELPPLAELQEAHLANQKKNEALNASNTALTRTERANTGRVNVGGANRDNRSGSATNNATPDRGTVGNPE